MRCEVLRLGVVVGRLSAVVEPAANMANLLDKMKKRSSVWRFFAEIPGNKVLCRLCSKRLTKHGNTSQMLRHLRGMHANEVNLLLQGELKMNSINWEQLEEQFQEETEAGQGGGGGGDGDDASKNDNKKKRSNVWLHFVEDGIDKVSCRICGEKLMNHGNTSSMIRHLRGKHPTLDIGTNAETQAQRLHLRNTSGEWRFLEVCERLFEENHLTDCTLMADGQFIQAHRLVLASCSDSFEELFKTVTHANPVIVLKDITMAELRGIINYMYKGEALVKSQHLPGLLKAAQQLRIRGLSQVSLDDTWLNNVDVDDVTLGAAAGQSSSSFGPSTSFFDQMDDSSNHAPDTADSLLDMIGATTSEDPNKVQIKVETGNETVSEAPLDADQEILKHFMADDPPMTDDLPNMDDDDDNEEYLDVTASPMAVGDNAETEEEPGPSTSTAVTSRKKVKPYTKQDLVTAVQMVQMNHLGLKPAAKAFNIPISTLLWHCKKAKATAKGD